LPGEAEKAAKILEAFVGKNANFNTLKYHPEVRIVADPDRPESALNAIPKAVLQRARGTLRNCSNSCNSTDFQRVEHRSSHFPSSQSRIRIQWKGRFRTCHRTTPRWFLVSAVLHRNRWTWVGSPNRRRHHRLCRRLEQ
jgi:hypothetical protein